MIGGRDSPIISGGRGEYEPVRYPSRIEVELSDGGTHEMDGLLALMFIRNCSVHRFSACDAMPRTRIRK